MVYPSIFQRWFRGRGPIVLCTMLMLLFGLTCGIQTAAAQSCIQDVWQAPHEGFKLNTQSLTCTANDVRVAYADNILDVEGNTLTQCVQGQYFSFIADFHVVLTAQERYDIGLYFATDGDANGDGALTGTCDANIITPWALDTQAPYTVYLGSKYPPGFVNLDASPDACGDITDDYNPQVVTVRVDNVLCQAKPGTTELSLPNCTSWRQSGANELCQVAFDAYPGSPSKCNCDPGFTVPIFVDTVDITVSKSAAPASRPEPGGQFTYTVSVHNDAQYTDVILDRICDDKFGTVKYYAGPTCTPGTLGTIDSTDCALPQTLAPGGDYQCTFNATIVSEPMPSIPDMVTVYGRGDPGNAPVSDTGSASVAITDVPPAALLTKSLDSLQCALVRYDVKVENTSTSKEDLTLTALNDSGFGDITSVQGNVKATTCILGTGVTVPWGSASAYTCTFDGYFCGLSHSNTVTATLKDNENNIVNPYGSVTVNVSATQGTP
ncbi:MAG: hypothetical protein JW902_13770 [Syntrophaceae bacterium]|nr:hypothetical protein [Syntrophaceae bacterium]